MYLDPGFGSMLIQVLIAAFAAAAAMFGIFRNRIKAFFNKGKNPGAEESVIEETPVEENLVGESPVEETANDE